MAKTSSAAAQKQQERQKRKQQSDRAKKMLTLGMPLKRENYVLLAIGVAGIALSYLLMVLDNQVDGFVSVTLCPILLVLSYSEIVFALLYKKPVQPEAESDVSSNGISNAA